MRGSHGIGVATVGVAAALALSACSGSDAPSESIVPASSPAEQQVTVVASTNVYGDIAKQIGGDKVRVISILSDPTQDPHSYEVNQTYPVELLRADIMIENGGEYDDFADAILKAAGNESIAVINAVELSGKRAASDGELNEHVWYDIRTVQKVADAIARDLSAVFAANAALFRVNAAVFQQKLAGLRAEEEKIKAAHDGVGVALTEAVPLYLLEASGLVNKTPREFSEAIEEGIDVPAAALNETLALLRSGDVKVLAYNEQTAGPETEKVLAEARANKVAVLPVTETLPEGQDYISWMASTLQALSAALD